MLNHYWGKDKNVVFNFKEGRIIKNLDAESFKITGENGEAEDKFHIQIYACYSQWQRIRTLCIEKNEEKIKAERTTAVWQNGGFSAKLNIWFSNKH